MKYRQTAAAGLLLALMLCGCAAGQAKAEFYAMDTVMQITACGAGAQEAVHAAQTEVYRLESLFSCREAGAELARCNAGQTALSTETAELIGRALELSAQTDGAYDPTLGALTAAWGFDDGNYRVPDAAQRAEALRCCGTDKVSLTENAAVLSGGVQLDLGGIGKGCAAAHVRQILLDGGVRSAIVSLGGNVCAVGAKPDGTDWTIGLQDPREPSSYFGTVAVRDAAVVTSGGYQRYFEQNGVRYHHILDGKTGTPAESGLLSVSVVSTDDTLADALSTALYVMGLEKGIAFWRAGGADFEAVWMTEDGSVWLTSGLCDAYRSQTPYQVVER